VKKSLTTSETVVISAHGIEKKTAKTAKEEIEKTKRTMKNYFKAKK
jgi:phage-related protein